MWDWLFECCAEVLGVTRRMRAIVLVPIAGLSLWLSVVALLEGGPRGLLVLFALLALALTASLPVMRARTALWNAARLPLADPKQPPDRDGADLPPTARALYALAGAVNEARRGGFLDAAHSLEKLDRDRLRPEEDRLFDAARAMVSLGLGDPRRAAALAARALPTSSEDLDFQLGRMMVAQAWSDADRLRKIDATWATAGVTPGTKDALPRLRAIVRLRIDTSTIEGLETWEAKSLADEARAVGDEALAADLESKSRAAPYR